MATNESLIRLSDSDITVWLDAVSREITPSGKSAQIVQVEAGEIVEIWYSGYQHFGSGGYSLSSRYAGMEPEFIEHCKGDHNSFTSTLAAKFRFAAPSIVTVWSGDDVGRRGRDFGTTVYVCASPEQIAQAVVETKAQRIAESADADLNVLKIYLKKMWTRAAEWRDRWISCGTNWSGDVEPAEHDHPQYIRAALTNPEGWTGYRIHSDQVTYDLRHEPEVLKAVRRAMYLPTAQERLVVYDEALEEYRTEQKAARVAFAKAQAEALEALGLTPKQAWKLIKATGAGMALDCAKWLLENLGVQHSGDARALLEKATRKSRKGYAAKYVADVFESLSLVPPPGGYQQMLKCLRGAQALGYISKEIEL